MGNDGWDQILAEADANNDAVRMERVRCAEAVKAEIESGRLRGAPETAGVMVILYRVLSAIENG